MAGLAPPLEALAARLRLSVERSWEDLGHVDVAMVHVKGEHFALHRLEGSSCQGTLVSVPRTTEDVDTDLDLLLTALGLDRRALTFIGSEETGYEEVGR
ncbi:hypothetical protein [Streptomyces sp. NPDC003077]|uniref:hypothetical protein n=1 Tax=Streptomyces sp. NPDC003077 TaxID=3154443 RepID=UPI0033A56A2D